MKTKRNRKRMLEAVLLAAVCFLQAISGFFPAKKAQAAVNAIEVWDENEIMDYGYRFNVKYQPGITEAVTFGCDNQDKEAFTNHGRSERNADTRRMTGVYEPESAGVRYNNVGRDGLGNIVDFKLSVVSVENAEPRYDMQTVIYRDKAEDGVSSTDGAYDWKDNIGQPLVGFSLESIGMYIYCVGSARVHFQFLKHGTDEPLSVSGHGTVRDLDAGQGVSVPPDSCLDSAYIIRGNDYLTVEGNSVTAGSGSLEPDDKKGWLNLLYNSDSIYFDFVHQFQLNRWDKDLADGIANYGTAEKFAEHIRGKYVDPDGNSYCPNYDGMKFMRGHAYFDFTCYCFGGVEMKKVPEKRVGSVGCAWEEAVSADRENPFPVKDFDEFQYMIRTEVTPNQLRFFMVRDQLEECLSIDDATRMKIFNDVGADVTEQFEILQEGQSVVFSAGEEVLSQENFTDNQVYTFVLPVHRKQNADTERYVSEDGYSILVPNSASMIYERTNGTGDTMNSETVWVRSVVPPELKVTKSVSQYERKVGDTADYTVTLTQTRENTRAVGVVMEDEIPQGLRLLEGEYFVETTPGVGECSIYGNDRGGWQVQCPSLGYGEVITVHYRCRVEENSNGQEMSNIVIVSAENMTDQGNGEQKNEKDIAEVWTNSPQLEIDKTADKYEWQVGDEVTYRVVVNNSVPGTVAKDVRISDIGLPEGLILANAAGSVEVLETPRQVEYPVPDKKTGQAFETRTVDSFLEADSSGFVFGCSYLPYSYPVTIVFHCTALENSNGRESINAASVQAENAPEKADDGEVYINTGELWIEKTADHYEWQVGEQVEYKVVTENRKEGTIARNVTVWDTDMPAGLALTSPDSVTISGIPESISEPEAGTEDIPGQVNPEYYQETVQKRVDYEFLPEGTGWRLNISDLPFAMPVTLTFFCTVTEEANGAESVNAAAVQAENAPEQMDNAEIYVNTAMLSLEKTVINPYMDAGDGREAGEFRVGEQVRYQVTVDNLQKGSIARDVMITDVSLPEGLALDCGEDALAVYGIPEIIMNPVMTADEAGNLLNPENYGQAEQKPVAFQLTREGTGWRLNISDLPYHTPVTVDFRCTVQGSVNGLEVVNRASAYAANAAQVEASAKIWVNSPVLKIVKEADKSFCKYGDTVNYQIKITQEQPGCVARNVGLADVIETPGMKLVKDSVSLFDENGNEADASVETSEINSFFLSTGRCLVSEGKYNIFDGMQGGLAEQVLANPLDLDEQKMMTVKYSAVAADPKLAGQVVHNTATAGSMENIPATSEETVEIRCPVLEIVKEADKREYLEGEKGYYKLTVRQLAKDIQADNIVIEDTVDSRGAIVQTENILVKKNGEKLENAVIEASENSFRVTANAGLGDLDKIEVLYEVLFGEAAVEGSTVYNAAVVRADGIPETGTELEVLVKGREPEPTATPAPTETPVPSPIPTATPCAKPTSVLKPTAIPTPTTAACPRLTPAPTRTPVSPYGNNGSNGGGSGSSYYQGNTGGNYQGSYLTGGAKTGDARPFERAAGVTVLAVVLMAAGIWMFRKAKKTGEKR